MFHAPVAGGVCKSRHGFMGVFYLRWLARILPRSAAKFSIAPEYNNGMEKKLRPRVRAVRLAAKVRQRLTEELGQPVQVILFGSQARGDAKKDSDIDLLVFLPSLESSMLYLAFDIAWEVGLDAGKVIQVVPAEKEEWKRLSASPFYQSVQREGVAV